MSPRKGIGTGKGGWFTKAVLGRVHTKNNVLIIIMGETGSSKSSAGLVLCKRFDRYFSLDRVVFTDVEFLDLLPKLKAKSWVLWDEAGVFLSHRRWQSSANIQIMQITQSFRNRFINVIYTAPQGKYIDKVIRDMCHFMIFMKRRGLGEVYRIVKSLYFPPYPKRIGYIYLQKPPESTYQGFTAKHVEHIEKVRQKSLKKREAKQKKEQDELQRALEPKYSFGDLVNRARSMAILPQIVNVDAKRETKLIDVWKMRELLTDGNPEEIKITKAYDIRKAILPEAQNLRTFLRTKRTEEARE